MRVICLGDLLLDVIVRLRQPLARSADTDSHIVLRTGGQAANVAAWVAELGAQARFLGKRANDDAGRLAAAGLTRLGVELAGPVEREGSGVIVSLVAVDGDRSMCSDRGVAPELQPEEIDVAWLAGCDHLHVSGYAIVREPVGLAAARAIEIARSQGARVSIDLSSWSAIRDFGPGRFRRLLEELEPDVVFANEQEHRILGGPLPETTWILKRGARGCSFQGVERAALPVEAVVDSTGAGDALAAGWIVGGPELALSAAARCVQRAGSMP